MRVAKGLAVLWILLMSSTSATAAGFRLPEAGAKAMGMGFAFTAQADDPSAIYFNPAGIVQLEGQNVMVGGTYVRQNGAEFTGTTPLTLNTATGTFDIRTETQKDLDFFVPNAYWTRRASPNFAYGVGIFVPFGLGQEYENRETSIFRNQITKVNLQTFVVNPTVAWKVIQTLSIGAGIDFMYGKAKLSQAGVVRLGAAPLDQVNIFQLDLEGDGTAWGYNFGLLFVPSGNWKFGLSYRSPFQLDIDDGDVRVRGANTLDTEASTKIDMPATVALGVAYVRDRLTLEADVDWTLWHKFRSLVIDIRNNTPFLPDAFRPEDWDDVAAFRVGAEYRVTDPLALRAGFAYDPTPVPASTMSPLLPDATRLNYMAGVGYRYANWTFDGSYFYVDKKDRTVNNQVNLAGPGIGSGFNGTWKGDAHVVAIDVGYRF